MIYIDIKFYSAKNSEQHTNANQEIFLQNTDQIYGIPVHAVGSKPVGHVIMLQLFDLVPTQFYFGI